MTQLVVGDIRALKGSCQLTEGNVASAVFPAAHETVAMHAGERPMDIMRLIAVPRERRQGLTGREAQEAVARRLARAEGYRTPIDRKTLKAPMQRGDGPATRTASTGRSCPRGRRAALWDLGHAAEQETTCLPSTPAPSTTSRKRT